MGCKITVWGTGVWCGMWESDGAAGFGPGGGFRLRLQGKSGFGARGVRFQSSGGQALGCPHSPWSPSSSYTAAHKKNPNA